MVQNLLNKQMHLKFSSFAFQINIKEIILKALVKKPLYSEEIFNPFIPITMIRINLIK